jgi:excisionase family DNA binding protein
VAVAGLAKSFVKEKDTQRMAVTLVRFVNGKPEREYLSPGGVAAYLGVTRRTVYTWMTEGRLRAVKTGPKLWLISMSDLGGFLDTTVMTAPAAAPVAPAVPAAARPIPKVAFTKSARSARRRK